MTEEIKQELIANGVDYPALVKRFMNKDQIAEKFLIKLITDETMENYAAAVAVNDAEALFKAAHTLKGICANLCVNCILDIIVPEVEVYRGGSVEGAAEVYARVKQEYDKICSIVKKIL